MMAQPQTRALVAPQPNVETQPFWDAAADGRLLIKRCGSCGKGHYYPRARCPNCFSDDTHWETTNGEGTIYSLSTMRRGPGAPFTLAYVTLDAGPSLLTNIIECDHDKLAIDQRVTVRFVATDDGPPLPMFMPI